MNVRSARHVRAAFGLWLLIAVVPCLPYLRPLWQGALADTPVADLVWVPVIGLVWIMLSLRDSPGYLDDVEMNVLFGLTLMAMAGVAFVLGPERWLFTFIGNSDGLIVWPIWVLGSVWLLFGLGATRQVALPIAYLWLAWPPLFTSIVSYSQTVLVPAAIGALKLFARAVPWLRPTGAPGTFTVVHGISTTAIYVSSACSGADSLIAVAIVLPLLLARLRGSIAGRSLLVASAAVGAFLFNLLRLVLLISAVRVTGPGFALGVLHPVLGFLLFALLLMLLGRLGRLLGLRPDTAPEPFSRLHLPGLRRLGLSLAGAAILGLVLWPLVPVFGGSPPGVVAMRSGPLIDAMPQIPGFRRVLVGTYDDSSILGPGSVSTAVAYSNPQGAYVLAEFWRTPNISTLETYGYQDCLLYHGNQVLATWPFQIAPGIPAVAYAVRRPAPPGGRPSEAVDVEWTVAARTGGRLEYIRIALAAPAEDAAAWGRAYRAPLPPVDTSVSAFGLPPQDGSFPGTVLGTVRAVARFAQRYHTAITEEPEAALRPGARHRRARA